MRALLDIVSTMLSFRVEGNDRPVILGYDRLYRPVILGLKETIDRLATANGVRWYGHVLRRDDDSVLRVALNLEVTGKRKRGRPKKTWKKQVEEEREKVGLKKEDALRRDKWRDGVREIAEGMG